MHAQCELAVVGAGPGGMRAALAAAKAGVQVTLVDANRQPGGQYYRQADLSGTPDEHGHQAKGQKLWQEVNAAGVTYLPETVVWGTVGESAGVHTLALNGPDAPAFLDAQAVILSTGAYDRPVAFPGWTLPGVMTAGAAQTLLKTQGILAGRRIVLAGTGPLQFVLAAELRHAGAEIVAILEGSHNLKPSVSQVGALWKQWGRLGEGLRSLADLTRHGVTIHMGWGIMAAHGEDDVTSVTVAPLDGAWHPVADQAQELACDTLLLGYGFIPANGLSVLMGAAQAWRPDLGGQVPVRDEMMETSLPGVYAVGDGAGIGGVLLAEVEGEIAGLAAAGRIQGQPERAERAIRKLGKELARERRFQTMYAELFTPEAGIYALAKADTILCRCEEVTLGQVQDAVALGQSTTNEVKMVTRCGMGDCQGRMCGQLVAQAVAKASGRSVAQVGLLAPRPPLFPIPIADLAQISAQEMAGVVGASGRKEDRI